MDVIVGASAGAVVGAYYAAVGLGVDDLIADARAFRGRHLLTYSLNLHLGGRFDRLLGSRCGIIPDRLHRLEVARFDRLHHGIRCLGIVCHDVAAGQPRYFATGRDHGVRLHDVVRASASIPYLFRARPVGAGGERWMLTDGGLSDPLPLAFARRPPLAATHLIVSDCRWVGTPPAPARDVVWIRPRMVSTGTLWAPRRASCRRFSKARRRSLKRWSPGFARGSRPTGGMRHRLCSGTSEARPMMSSCLGTSLAPIGLHRR